MAPLRILRSMIALASLTACGGAAVEPKTNPPIPASASATNTGTSTTSAPTPSASAPAQLSPPPDEKGVAQALGIDQAEKSPDGTVKGSFPRTDVAVAIDNWKIPPFMGLTSWAAFAPAKAGVADAMVMGDLVLFEDEVNPVMSVLLDGGLSVTALHNHFFFDAPKVFFMHIGGEGTVAAMGKTVRAAIDKTAEIRKKGKPATTFGAATLPPKSTIDAAKLEAALGVKGQAKDGMFKATIGRQVNAGCGCPAGKAMGVNTWAAFAGSDDVAVVDGDFAVTEDELQPVLKALRSGKIDIVAIHHHMSGESPRMLFLHYWGRGKAGDLAATIKRALELTKAETPKATSHLDVTAIECTVTSG